MARRFFEFYCEEFEKVRKGTVGFSHLKTQRHDDFFCEEFEKVRKGTVVFAHFVAETN